MDITSKKRHLDETDSFYDRFSRMFMVRFFIVAGLIMLVEYFTNRMQCNPHKNIFLDVSYIKGSCWASGLYIYKELQTRLKETALYGIPSNGGYNGLNDQNELCQTTDSFMLPNDDCKPMTKQYNKHYQWLPFYVLSLSILYYLPYTVYKIVNPDLISLNNIMTSSFPVRAQMIVSNYFNYSINPISRLRLRIWLNVLVKLMYIVVNVFAYVFTGYMVSGDYESYGTNFRDWISQNASHTEMHHPGNVLLPVTGLCDITDLSSLRENTVQVICEIPANNFYQYVLLVSWHLFIIGISMSVTGLVVNLGNHLYRFLCYGNEISVRKIYRYITLRESEYLVMIKRKDVVVYGEVLRKLKELRSDEQGKFLTINDIDGSIPEEDDIVSAV